jgi:hypothetical protein
MAQTLDGSAFPQVVRFTLGGSNVATQVVIPPSARTATVRFETNDGKLAFTGTDGGAVAAAHIICAGDTTNEFSLLDGIHTSSGVTSFFVASATGSTLCSVMIEG